MRRRRLLALASGQQQREDIPHAVSVSRRLIARHLGGLQSMNTVIHHHVSLSDDSHPAQSSMDSGDMQHGRFWFLSDRIHLYTCFPHPPLLHQLALFVHFWSIHCKDNFLETFRQKHH